MILKFIFYFCKGGTERKVRYFYWLNTISCLQVLVHNVLCVFVFLCMLNKKANAETAT